MTITYVKIASVAVGAGGAASMDFSSIPATYTDLKLVFMLRYNGSLDTRFKVRFNADSGANYSFKILEGNGASASSSGASVTTSIQSDSGNYAATTSSVFSSGELYIPNYLSANQKSVSIDNVEENNAATAYATLVAGLWSGTAAINEITISPLSDQLVQYSSATLYGIKSS